MDDQNKGMKERWSPASTTPERGYANDPGYSSGDYGTGRPFGDDRPYGNDRLQDERLPGEDLASSRSDDEDTDRRAREIRSDIDRTRDQMSGTIDAIQDRLSPRNAMSRAAEGVREATVGRVRDMAHNVQERMPQMGRSVPGDGFMDRVRDNPIPAAIAAASLAWLAFGGRRDRQHDRSRAIYGSTRGGAAFVRETRIDLDQDDDAAYTGVSGSTAGRTYASRVEGMGNRMPDATRRMRHAGTDAGQRARRAAEQNPLAAGAVAAAIGLAIGLMIPETEPENRVMGDTRDSLMEKGRETVRDAAEKVKETAGEVQKVATRAIGATDTDASRGGADKT